MANELYLESYNDFCIRCSNIKTLYLNMNDLEKRIYKNYIYSLKMRNFLKDIIWEYLNDDKDNFAIMVYFKYENNNKR